MSPIAVHDTILNTGAKMPAVGVGCWFQGRRDGECPETYDMITNALKFGYRHIDTAWGYGNEQAVGKAIRESGIPREAIFVTTKLTNEHHGRVNEGFQESLRALDIGYIDLYLVHWPQAGDAKGKTIPYGESPTIQETWSEVEKLVGDKCRAIGVSNFSIKNLKLLENAKVVPAVDQVESHIYLPQASLTEYCKDKGIILTAYSPLGQPPAGGQSPSPILQEPLVGELAKKYNTKPGTILISWVAQRPGWNVIPKSSNADRLKANFDIVKLSQADHDALSAIHKEPGKTTSLVDYAPKMKKEGVVFGYTVEQMGWEHLD